MRVMVLVKASPESEAGVMPDEKLLTEMGKFNEELVKAGVMLAGEGLHPTSKAARVRFRLGSIFSQGDQADQRWKSLMSEKTLSGGALMVVERSIRNASGLVAA